MPLSPSLATLRAAIVLEIKTAMNPASPGLVTTVHPYRRWWKDEAKFRQLFERTDIVATPPPPNLQKKINGWMVSRSRTVETETEERWRFYNLHTFQLRGIMGIKEVDDSEQAFQDQIELIRDRFRLNTTIFGNTERTSPVSNVVSFDREQIGEANCWSAILEVTPEAIETKFL